MTPDELRGLVFAAMAAEDEAAGYQATFQGLTDAVMPVLAEALAERDAVFAELRAELVTARAQINEWRGHFTSIAEILRPYGDEVDSPVELAGKAAAEIQQLRAEEALAHAVLREAIERGTHEPEDMDGPAEQWRLDECEIDGGFAGTEYPRLWPPRQAALPEGTPAETTYRPSGTVQRGLHGEECDGSSGCRALSHIDGCFANFPEGHAEPEPAWGEDRMVHGHAEQETERQQ